MISIKLETIKKQRSNINLIASAHKRREGFYTLTDRSTSEHNLRSVNKLLLDTPKICTMKFEKSFIISSIKLWNQLCEDHKEIPPNKYQLLKLRIKKEMLQNKLNFPE